jgi:hypothetical protein
MNDPHSIWKHQPTEAFKMSADQLRQRAYQRKKKSRFEAFYSIIIGLVLFVFFARGCVMIHELVTRVGYGVLSLWSLYFAYKSCKRIWLDRLAPEATMDTTIRSYRTELEKRYDFGRHVWRTLLPAFLGMALIVAPVLIRDIATTPRLIANLAPLFVLLAIWLAVFIPKRQRAQRELQREIEMLRTFEKEYQS